MELPLFFPVPTTNQIPTTSVCCCSKVVVKLPSKRRNVVVSGNRVVRVKVKATVERNGSDGIDAGDRKSGVAGASSGGGYSSSTMEVTTFNQSFSDAEFPVWDQIGAVVRLSYGIG